MTQATVNFAVLSDPGASGDSWVGVQVSGLSGSLAGPGLSAGVTGAGIQVNEASDPTTGVVDWNALGGTGVTLSTAIVSVAGTLTGLKAFDLVSGDASFSVTRIYVSPTDPALTNVPLLYGTLTIQNITLGSSSLGIHLTGGMISFASLDDSVTSGKSWFGLEATGLQGTFAGPGLSGGVMNGRINLNEGSLDAVHPTLIDENPDAAPVDWNQQGLSVTGLDLSGSLAEVSGDVVGLDIFGLVEGDVSFDVSRTVVSTSAPNPVLAGAPLLVGSLTIGANQHLRLGTSGFGVDSGL